MSAAALREAFEMQAKACESLGSPFNARLCALLAARLAPGQPGTDRLVAWEGDLSFRGDSVPLRLCGALHFLARSGRAGMASVYPPHEVGDDALWATVSDVLVSEAEVIDRYLDSPPQTNEVRRSAALIAAGHWLSARHPLPFVLSELGASAGLNLYWDRYALSAGGRRLGPGEAVLELAPDWTGPVPEGPLPVVAERRGTDLNPVTDMERLKSYVWPDQPERMALTEAAIAAGPAQVDRASAEVWIEGRLTPRPGHLHLVYHTVAWQYFPPSVQDRARALIEAAGARAGADAPLAWLSMETDETPFSGAALTLRLWPGGETVMLGRIDFHGRWVRWEAR